MKHKFGFLLIISTMFMSLNGQSIPKHPVGNSEFGRTNNFNSGWKFHLGEVPGFMVPNFVDQSWRTLELPHDWSIEGDFDQSNPSGESGGFLPNGIGCYRKSFTIPTNLKGKRISIRFDGVYMNSTVYLNGAYIGNRPYGFSTFEYDLTPNLKYGDQENIIAVKVDHSLQPSCRWYTGSGINRNVYLLIKPQQHFKSNGIFFRTESLSSGSAKLKVDFTVVAHNYLESQAVAFQHLPEDIKRTVKTYRIISSLIDKEGVKKVSAETTGKLSDFTILNDSLRMEIEHPKLWSDVSPYLYELKNQLEIDGKVVDEETIRVGIRKVEFNSREGMLVNGLKTTIKGVCLHKDAGSFGTAVPKDIWRYRLQKLKAMGCNAIRTHGPVDPVFIETCDEMGFFMMAEAFDEWNTNWRWGYSENPEGKRPFAYHLFYNQWAETDLKTMVYRDRNHPSIFIYSVGNEVPDQRAKEGPAKLSQLKTWVKEVDSTRPVIAACDWSPFANQSGFMDIIDIAGYNYIDRYFPGLYADEHKKYPDRILLGTETYPDLKNWLSVRDHPYVTGEFLWVGIDYQGEAVAWPRKGWEWGLIDLAGFEKPTYYIRQSYWTETPMVHIAVNLKKKEKFKWQCYNVASHWNFEKDETDTVFVYSNCEEVELFLNNKSLGRKKVNIDTYYASYVVKFMEGTLKAIALNHSKKVASHVLKTAGQPHHLELLPERDTVEIAKGELVFLTVGVTDNNGVRCPNATNNIRVSIEGAGELIGLDSGNQFSHEHYKTDNRNAFEGRILATVKPLKPGEIKVQAICEGLVLATKTIYVK
jgi:beta-galactosidase